MGGEAATNQARQEHGYARTRLPWQASEISPITSFKYSTFNV